MPPQNSSDRFTKVYLMLWGVCLFIALVGLVFYKIGFRLGSGLEPVKVGSISFASNEMNPQLFLDNREKKVTLEGDHYVLKNITPGPHSLVVSKSGFWPWAKTVTTRSDSVRKLFAFLFPMKGIKTEALAAGTAEYTRALKSLRTPLPEVLPGSAPFTSEESLEKWLTENVPNVMRSNDKSTALYIQDGTIYLAWVSETEPPPHYFCEENPCKLTIPVTVSSQSINSVGFYKNRSDVILFASGSTVYGIEADREGTQNFQPLYSGSDPYFGESDDGTLYIRDSGTVLKATL